MTDAFWARRDWLQINLRGNGVSVQWNGNEV